MSEATSLHRTTVCRVDDPQGLLRKPTHEHGPYDRPRCATRIRSPSKGKGFGVLISESEGMMPLGHTAAAPARYTR